MPFDGATFTQTCDAVAKMDKVINFLIDEKHWCKLRLRRHDGARCILGAMMAADGTVELKQPVLRAIKQVTGRDYLRIEMFNDHPLTTHGLVVKVLHRAREIIALG